MKKLMIIMLLINSFLFASELDKLENQYFNKMDVLEKDFESKTLSLTELYLKTLNKLLEQETKKGDFESAMEVKKKIVEIENILNPKVNLIGKKYQWLSNNICEFGVENIFKTSSKDRTYKVIGKWKFDSRKVLITTNQSKFLLTFNDDYTSYTVEKDGKKYDTVFREIK